MAPRWVQCMVQLVYGHVTKSLRVRLTPGSLQATLSKLLTYTHTTHTVCSGQLSLLLLAGREMSSSYGYGMKA